MFRQVGRGAEEQSRPPEAPRSGCSAAKSLYGSDRLCEKRSEAGAARKEEIREILSLGFESERTVNQRGDSPATAGTIRSTRVKEKSNFAYLAFFLNLFRRTV